MSVRVANNFLIVSSLKWYGRFYQLLLSKVSGFQELGNKLIEEAEAAIACCQVDKLEELGMLLSTLPVKEYQMAGQYYVAWCGYRKGEDVSESFEQVIESSDAYRVRALISLGALCTRKGNIVSGLNYYSNAVRYADTPSTLVSAGKAIAVIKSIDGYHQEALKDLENLTPFVRHASPKVYYDYLNSLAVELSELGHVEEARNISLITNNSPLAAYYPEWRETLREINLKTKNNSTIHINIKEDNTEQEITTLPEIPLNDEIDSELAQMFDKEFAPGYPQPFHPEVAEAITSFDELAIKYGPQALLAVLLRMVLGHRITEKEIQVICDVFYNDDANNNLNHDTDQPSESFHSGLSYAPEPVEGRDYLKGLEIESNSKADQQTNKDISPNEIDLENIITLENLMTNWCNQDISPEQITFVLSALRDCKDDAKRSNIIDRMIYIAFRESKDGIHSEAEWRKKYESRLKSENNDPQ